MNYKENDNLKYNNLMKRDLSKYNNKIDNEKILNKYIKKEKSDELLDDLKKLKESLEEIMKMAFVMSYGNTGDDMDIVTNGVFFPKAITKDGLVLYEKRYLTLDGVVSDEEEKLYVPLNEAVSKYNSNLCEISTDTVLSIDFSISQMRKIYPASSVPYYDSFKGYGLEEINAKYYTGEVRRGNNYDLIPFIIDDNYKLNKKLTKGYYKKDEPAYEVQLVEEPKTKILR